MKYCALDQALVTTGWAIFEEDKIVKAGTFTTNSSDPIAKRLGKFWTNLSSLHTTHEFDCLFLEDIQQQTNVETYKKLCYVQAAVLLWCYWNDVPCSILGPSHWRSIIKEKYKVSFGRKRAEQKKAAQQFVKQQFNIKASEDTCDAICIGLAGIQERKRNESAF